MGVVPQPQQLSGEIPRELSNLINLQVMSLSHNLLTGEIPPQLGDLVNLTRMFLCGNPLSGCVPTSLQGKADSNCWTAEYLEG